MLVPPLAFDSFSLHATTKYPKRMLGLYEQSCACSVIGAFMVGQHTVFISSK